MALPLLTPGRRRRSRWPYALAAPLLAAAILVAAREAWPHGGSPTRRAARGAGAASGPRVGRPRSRPEGRRKQAPPASPALLDKAGAGHLHRFSPRLGARGAILVNEGTGRVLWASRPYRRLPIASTTKIMTAVLALERLRPSQIVTITRLPPRVPLVREGLRAGERVPARKLLYALLLYSGNDDALALAQASAGSRPAFVRLMNDRAGPSAFGRPTSRPRAA